MCHGFARGPQYRGGGERLKKWRKKTRNVLCWSKKNISLHTAKDPVGCHI